MKDKKAKSNTGAYPPQQPRPQNNYGSPYVQMMQHSRSTYGGGYGGGGYGGQPSYGGRGGQPQGYGGYGGQPNYGGRGGQPQGYGGYGGYGGNRGGRRQAMQPTLVEPKSKRTVFVLLILILALAMVATAALSFLKVMPDTLNMFKIVHIPADNEDGLDEKADIINADDIIFSMIEQLKGEETSAEAATETEEGEGEEADPQTIYYYQNTFGLEREGEMETMDLIAYWLIPIAFALSMVMALIILIKAIVAMFSKKRTGFKALSIILLVTVLLGIVGAYLWAGPENLSLDFFLGQGSGVVLGMYYLIWAGIALVMFIFSLFAYQTKKKSQAYWQYPDGRVEPAIKAKKGKKQ